MNSVALKRLEKTNLFDYDMARLRDFFISHGEKPFRAQQVMQWIHQRQRTDFDAMTDLSRSLRAWLANNTEVRVLRSAFDRESEDGTRKWLLSLPEGNHIETVFIPEEGRGTLCISSQVGCGLNCQFCATATQGFNRNLTAGEIIAQLWHAVNELQQEGRGRKVTNVVMMGMGEPLLNYDNVLIAMRVMMDDLAYGLSKYRVTLSTSGVLPNMRRLSQDSACALAVSLHAPNDNLRNQLVPINRKYPIAELMGLCRTYYPEGSKRTITMEYVMLDQVNDQTEHAKQLLRVLRGVQAKVNLIPFNTFPGTRYRCSSPEAIQHFRDILTSGGVVTTIRKTRGEDISAACGQLVGNFTDRTSRSRLYAQRNSALMDPPTRRLEGDSLAVS